MDRRPQPGCPNVFRLFRVILDQRGRHDAAGMLGGDGLVSIRHRCNMPAARVVALRKERRYQHLIPCGRYGMYRRSDRPAHAVAGVGHRHRRQQRPAQILLAGAYDGRHRRVHVMHAGGLPLALTVPRGYDKRLAAADGELVHTSDNAPHGVLRQRPHRLQAISFHDLRLGREYRWARHAPVDDLRRAAPLGQSIRAGLAVGGLRPDNRLSVTAGDQIEALTRGRRTVVRRDQLPIFYGVPQLSELVDEFPERGTCQSFDRLALPNRPPRLELLHILQNDDAGPYRCRPAQRDPRKAANLPVDQRSAFSFAEVLAVRREPRQSHRPPSAHGLGVDVPHGRLKMLRVRVVGAVHQDRRRIVVDGNRHRPARCNLNAC